MITFEQEKQAKEELVEFLNYALLFLSEVADKLLENDGDTLLANDQRQALDSVFSVFHNDFDVELAENQIWEIHPCDLESSGLYGWRLHIKIRAIQYWDQRYAPTALEKTLYLPCLTTAIDNLLNKLIKDCCIDESPLELSRLLRHLIRTTDSSSGQALSWLSDEPPVQECLPIIAQEHDFQSAHPDASR